MDSGRGGDRRGRVALAVGACGSESRHADAGSDVGRRHWQHHGLCRGVADRSFTQIGKDFEAANPGSKVIFNFAASSALATQINEGAPADVFASASPATMKT